MELQFFFIVESLWKIFLSHNTWISNGFSLILEIKGYVLHTRKDVGEWKETTLGSEIRSYRLNNLDCGTRYEVYLSAFNKIGIGAPSEVLTMSTNGSGERELHWSFFCCYILANN